MTEPKFTPGARVRVRAFDPPGHARTPSYVRGKIGWVATLHGVFRNPESLAHGGDGLPKQPLYLIGFRQADLWPRYTGRPADTLYLDIYEHWLDPA